MVADAAGYRWSSAMAHLTGLDVTGSLDLRYWAERVGPEEWRSELGVTEDPDELRRSAPKRPGDLIVAEQ